MHAIQPSAGLIYLHRGADVDLSPNRDLGTMHVRQRNAMQGDSVRHVDELSALMQGWVSQSIESAQV